MELLWHVTARQASRGDIGRISDEDIALAIDYRQSPELLIEALVHSGWIDRNLTHRLIIHDWPDHAENGVHMRLARAHQFFVCGDPRNPEKTSLVIPKLTNLPPRDRALAEDFYGKQSVATLCNNLFTNGHGMDTNTESVATDLEIVDTTRPRRGHGGSPPILDQSLTPPVSTEETKSIQHHRRKSDDVESPFLETIKTLSGIQRLSSGDRKFCADLESSGTSLDAVKAGILVGRARRLIHESKTGKTEAIQSLRYFTNTIEEAKGGLFEAGYVSHIEDWLRRKNGKH